MNKLTRLTINKFRNVAPTTLDFRPGINVLLGRNAAGKTTLLRLISSLLGNDNELPQDELLDASFHVTGHELEFEQTTRRAQFEEPALPSELTSQGTSPFSRVHQTGSFIFKQGNNLILKAELLPDEITLEHSGSQSRIARYFQGSPLPSLINSLFRKAQDDNDFLHLGTRIFSSWAPPAERLDESLEYFHSLLNINAYVEGPGWRWNSEIQIPKSMRRALPELPPGTTVSFEFAFLNRVARILGYDSATARFDTERIVPEPHRQIGRVSNPKFYFNQGGEQVSHEWLSYGQKRLLAFFAHADASPEIVIADELVNGLHHEWISACLNEISDRQSFLTSQNPLLLDFLRFDNIEDVRRTFILCERTSSDAGAQLIWRNPTEDEAESFFVAYQTGIQRVSDILLTKGLW